MKKVFIVALTWNRSDLIEECLTSLRKVKSKHKICVIVVDNHSIDDTVRIIKQKFPEVILIRNKKNLGWSGGNNKGIAFALKKHADYILLLNNDITIDKQCIDNLVKVMESDTTLGIVGPKIFRSGTNPRIISNAGNFFTKDFFGYSRGGGRIDNGKYNSVVKVDFVAGVAFAKAAVFEKVGFFDERYFLYFEDVDFCMRAKKMGYSFAFVPDAFEFHRESATIGLNSPTHIYYNTRNHLLFVQEHFGTLELLKQLYKSMRLILMKIKNRQEDTKYHALGMRDYLLRRFYGQQYWK